MGPEGVLQEVPHITTECIGTQCRRKFKSLVAISSLGVGDMRQWG